MVKETELLKVTEIMNARDAQSRRSQTKTKINAFIQIVMILSILTRKANAKNVTHMKNHYTRNQDYMARVMKHLNVISKSVI